MLLHIMKSIVKWESPERDRGRQSDRGGTFFRDRTRQANKERVPRKKVPGPFLSLRSLITPPLIAGQERGRGQERGA